MLTNDTKHSWQTVIAYLLDDDLTPHTPTQWRRVWVHDYHIVAEVLKAWGHGGEKGSQ